MRITPHPNPLEKITLHSWGGKGFFSFFLGKKGKSSRADAGDYKKDKVLVSSQHRKE